MMQPPLTGASTQVKVPMPQSSAKEPYASSALYSPQSLVMLVSAVMAGAVVSSMVKVAVDDELLPAQSVTVKVTIAEPVAPQSSLKPMKSLLQVSSPSQLSMADAPPWLSNHASKAAMLPMPSHSTVSSPASMISGAVVSSTVTICSQVDSLPQKSVTVQRRCKKYSLGHAPSKRTSVPSEMVTASPQLSLAVMASGPAMAGTLSHSTVASMGPSVMVGGVVSSRETVNVSEMRRPQSESKAEMLNDTASSQGSSLPWVQSPKSQTKSPDNPDMSLPFKVPSHLNQPPKPLAQLWLLAPSPSWNRLFKDTGMWSSSRKPTKSPPPMRTEFSAMVNTVISSSSMSQSWYPSCSGSSLIKRAWLGSSANHSDATCPPSNVA